MSPPRRPYLLRALHEWICDSELTPHIIVDASVAGVQVPSDHVSDGKIILNISHHATEHLVLANDGVSFSARFGGKSVQINLPCAAVIGIYARETGEGMLFTDDDAPDDSPPGGDDGPDRPHLKIVK